MPRAETKKDDPNRALVERVQRELPYGTTAFRELVDKLGPSVYARAKRILGTSHDAEDALQQVFFRVFRAIGVYRFERPFDHWLQVITLNTCLHMLRTRRRDRRRLDALRADSPRISPAPPENDPVLRRRLASLLDKLDPDSRICVVLRVLEERSYAEIAEVLDMTETAVRKRFQRGAEQLRTLYGQDAHHRRKK